MPIIFNYLSTIQYTSEDSELTHYYMICISINTGLMFGKNAYTSNNLLTFRTDFVKAVYYHIFDLIPCMEQAKQYHDSNFVFWFEVNAFKAHRIDFCFDLKTMYQEYIKLINKGYSLREMVYKRNYYNDEEITKIQGDDDHDIPDVETIAPELKRRELQYILTPEVENYISKSYVKALTGTGGYVTWDKARTVINQSKYKRPKRDKLIKLVETISSKHGIAKVLEQVENGTITEFGSLKKVKSYLKEIQTEFNINPVTISQTMTLMKECHLRNTRLPKSC